MKKIVSSLSYFIQSSLIHSLKLQLSSGKMLMEEMDGEDFIEEELTSIELVNMALEVVEASPSNLVLNVDPIPNVGDQRPPIVKLTDTQHHASMLSHFLLNNSVNFSVQDVTNFQKVLRKLDKMGVANHNKQQQRTSNSYFRSS